MKNHITKYFINFDCTKECTHSKICKRMPAEVVMINNLNKVQILFLGIGAGCIDYQKNMNFVGPAGKYLRKAIAYIWNINLFSLALSNVVKFRPTQLIDGKVKDREPTREETNNCSEFWIRDIEIIKPKVIMPLGHCAAYTLFPDLYDLKMGDIRLIKDRKYMDTPVAFTWHPSFLNRKYQKFDIKNNNELFHKQFLSDIKKVL